MLRVNVNKNSDKDGERHVDMDALSQSTKRLAEETSEVNDCSFKQHWLLLEVTKRKRYIETTNIPSDDMRRKDSE